MVNGCSIVFITAISVVAFSDVSGMDIKINEMKKTKDDKLKYHREYMNEYREKHKDRVRANRNKARDGRNTEVFIMNCF